MSHEAKSSKSPLSASLQKLGSFRMFNGKGEPKDEKNYASSSPSNSLADDGDYSPFIQDDEFEVNTPSHLEIRLTQSSSPRPQRG